MANRLGRFLCFTVVILALSAASFAQIGVGIMVSFGPPPLPVYEQPLCPGEGYIWTPGFWAWDADFDDYYWVPGTWVLAPTVGYLWTPGWWGWGGGGYYWHEGFWGPEVGFYGGINYGFGYFGHGYEGGRWQDGRFYYNRAVNNVNVTNIHNVYNTTVINNTTVNRVSYNGGNGGITARATPQEQAAVQAKHVPPTAVQTQHIQAARSDQQLRASVNQGKPPIAATAKPADFKGSGVVAARQAGGPYTPPPVNRAGNQPKGNPQAARPENNAARPSTAVHPNELPPIPHAPAANSGNAEADQKYQQQQEQLRVQQQQERQKLQQQQEQQHQQVAQQQANEAKQQLERQHQQQTQQLQQQHAQQQQQLARQQQQQMQARQQQPHATQPKPPHE